jgi:hypothetical protein
MDAAAIATAPVPAFRTLSQWPVTNQRFTVRRLTICRGGRAKANVAVGMNQRNHSEMTSEWEIFMAQAILDGFRPHRFSPPASAASRLDPVVVFKTDEWPERRKLKSLGLSMTRRMR